MRFRHASPSASYLHCPGAEPLRYLTAGDAFQEAADRWPARPAVHSLHQQKKITYGELLLQADALGCALREAGLARGSRLGVWAHSCAEWLVVLAASARVGLIPSMRNQSLVFCIKKVGLKALLIGEEVLGRDYYKVLNTVIPEIKDSKPGHLSSATFPDLKVVITCGSKELPGMFSLDSLIKGYMNKSKSQASTYSAQVKPEDGCIIHFTSGTTGEPKAALDSHFGVVNNSYLLGKRTTLHEGHNTICVQVSTKVVLTPVNRYGRLVGIGVEEGGGVPLFHAFGTIISLMAAVRLGSTLVLPAATYSSAANADSLFKERCTVIHGTPTMFVDLINTVRQRALTPAVRVALTAGAPCSPQLFRDIKTHLGIESVKSLYGMTETTAAVFQSLPGETEEQITQTVGYIHDHLELKVVDENNTVVPFGRPGELLVRGYSTMMGYWDEPEKTRQTIDPDGWLRTGDQFTLSEDGYGRVVGRLKDIVVRGGENIAPKEIEDLLNEHPSILESQVVGVPDERLGEEVCAVLRLQGGAKINLDDVKAFCSGRLAKYKVPRILYVVEDFPKTASGKIQKYKLREMIESGKLR
ncbi:Acyl-CoA synthetase family member 2, mitochondrial [Eumeta japonica]|uniref:Medium-chain acyl-CoA ligase ACSF2, mitochondrial n=1 Tax=Eumeta variegata TaxID=151549 RepID=A0A4C1SB44_EUMVA|nr:Acyl-CoA synthetase family member 2, mitochondrial [Eumeta japonica]